MPAQEASPPASPMSSGLIGLGATEVVVLAYLVRNESEPVVMDGFRQEHKVDSSRNQSRF